MKKTIMFMLSLSSLTCFSQSQQKTKTDSAVRVQDTTKIYGLLISEQELKDIIQLIGEADEKPSVIKYYQNILWARKELIKQPAINTKTQNK